MTETHNEHEKKSFWSDLLRFAVIAIIVILPIRLFIAQPFVVSGASMEPAFHNGQYLIVDELSYHFEDPKRGEVIVFKYPFENRFLIKRVIGVPFDTVILDKGITSIQNSAHPKGFTLSEPYVEAKRNFTEGHIERTLKAGEYFVMGDNRLESSDSRIWGPLNRGQIVGRPLLRLFPISSISLFPGEHLSNK